MEEFVERDKMTVETDYLSLLMRRGKLKEIRRTKGTYVLRITSNYFLALLLRLTHSKQGIGQKRRASLRRAS